MKRIVIGFLTVSMMLLNSCEKYPINQIGFTSDITRNSNGITMMYIESGVDLIHLEGTVLVSTRTINVSLEAPGGEVVYSNSIQSPDNIFINKVFNAQKGYWKLKYSSNQGTGAIDLHLWY